MQFNVDFRGATYGFEFVRDRGRAIRLLNGYHSRGRSTFAVDFETGALPQYKIHDGAALSPHLSKARLLQLFDGSSGVVFDLWEIGEDHLFKEFFESHNLIAHNATFELGFLKKQFGCKDINIGCTLLLGKLLCHATRPHDVGLSLEALIQNVLKIEAHKELQTSDWAKPNLTFEQIEYAALDAFYTWWVAQELATGLEKYGLQTIYSLYRRAQDPITELQLNGIKVNTEGHRKILNQWRLDLYKARCELESLTGLSKLTNHSIAGWLEAHLDSEALALWPRSDLGKLRTNKEAFSDFEWHPLAAPFQRWHKLDKLCSSFGESLVSLINPATKRLHASYNLAGARTGRLSCSKPNLQQIVRDEAFRTIFEPREGFSFVVCDYSQIELRVAAELSQDPMMLKAFSQGLDIHALTASQMARVPLDQVTLDQRQKAKAVTFGSIYGIGPTKLEGYSKQSYGAELQPGEARQIIETFRETYAGYWAWFFAIVKFAEEHGYVVTPSGKRRRLHSDQYYGAAANTLIQGGAAEVMLCALVELYSRIKDSRAKLVNCIHDEIVLEVPHGREELGASILKDSMIQGFLKVFSKGVVQGLCEPSWGSNWSSAKSGGTSLAA